MNAYLFPAIEAGPTIVARLIKLIPQSRWDTALEPGRFTLREVVAHLADWEPIMRERISRAVTQPGTLIEAYDEGQMAIDNGYNKTDPCEQAEEFRLERTETADYIKSISTDMMTNAAIHPERGRQTVEDLANLLLGHDLYHVEQLSGYLLDLA